MDKESLYRGLISLLSDGQERTTEQLLAEFTAEFPGTIKGLQHSWISENGFSCGAVQYPYTIISQSLEELSAAGRVTKIAHKLWALRTRPGNN